MNTSELYLPILSDIPILKFVPTLPLRSSVTDKSIGMSGTMYLYLGVDKDTRLQLEEASELKLTLFDVFYLKFRETYCGYFINSKAPNINTTNASIVAFSNGYKRGITSDQKQEMNLVYSTQYFSAFASLSGCNMLLRQINNAAFIEKLES